MVTKVGLQSDFASALKDLIELDFDAVEAYEAAINRLENASYREKLEEFKADHQRHIEDLSNLLREKGIDAPTSPSVKQWLTKGKTILAQLLGDDAILKAMISNEEDTNTAYERICHHDHLWPEAKEIVNNGWDDEKRHKQWLEAQVK